MKIKRLLALLVCAVLLLGVSDVASAQGRVDRNVVYGMYSGTALLLDVHYPAKPNGFGIVFIPGSGWSAPLGYAAPPLKESEQVGMYVPSLTEAGYTVFAVTHRATPTFRYPAQVEDAERAVRFVRANASKYGIDPARLGGAGGSSGAHLVSLLVSTSSAPFLLIHGDVDRTVPFHQSELMEAALKKAGVPVKLVRIPGGDHGPTFPGATNPPDYKGEMVKWFDLYLCKTQ